MTEIKSCKNCKHYCPFWLGPKKFDKCSAHQWTKDKHCSYIDLIFDYPDIYGESSLPCRPNNLVRWERKLTLKEHLQNFYKSITNFLK